MAMTASSRAPQDAGTQQSERSPFARLTELLAPYQPGKPLITLSLGEPQHPVPAFVGPVLAKHIADTIPGAELVILPNAGHVPHLEVPDVFYKALVKFVTAR